MRQKMNITEYTPLPTDIYLMDTNILIKLFYPIDYGGSIEQYENLYFKAKEIGAKFLVSSIQISEFINRCIRTQFNLYMDKINNKNLNYKKEYRISDDYRECMSAILEIVEFDIVPNFTFVDDGFSKIKTSEILRYGFSYDFNDSLLVQIAKLQKAIVITDDCDFANYGSDFKVLTSNNKLLMFS